MKLIDIKKDKIYLMESLKTDSFTNHLIIHSGNDKNMNLFIKILIGLLKKNKYDNLKDIVNIEFSYYKENDNLLEGCDWYDMPEYKINEEFLGIYKPHRELLRYAIKNSQFLCPDHFFRNIDLKTVMQEIDKRRIRFTCTCSKDNFHKTAYLRVPRFILVIFLRPYYRLPLKLRTRIRRFLR